MSNSSRANRSKRRKESQEFNNSQNLSNQIQKLYPKTKNQDRLIGSIKQNHISIASGPAGVGKSLIALHEAIWLLEKGIIDKILYTKPTVNFLEQKGIGFIPGPIEEKLLPLMFPLLDNLEVFVSSGKIKYMLDKKQIEFQLLEYVRGRSLRNTFVICDEFQSVSPLGALTMISRIESTSKLVILGDPKQADIKLKSNALEDSIYRLKGAQSTGIIQFSKEDIVRSSFLKDVISRYDIA
jgi:phosphate starvation-inducible PhoH-like protein